MQTPAGYEIRDGVFYVTNWLEVIFNPSFPYRFTHMVLAAYCTTAMVVAYVGAHLLPANPNRESARVMTRMALGLLAVMVPVQITAGHEHGVNVHEMQPAKLAAIEAHWESYGRGAPLVLFALPNEKTESDDYPIKIPKLGSLIVGGSLDAPMRGLREWSSNERPPAVITFWSFRTMVGMGIIMLFIGLCGMYLMLRGRLRQQRWFPT